MENVLFIFISILLLETTLIHFSTGFIDTSSTTSIKSEDGDIIDCVDMYKQPAFGHPSLKNHKIQMRPSYNPSKKLSTISKWEDATTVTSQIWHTSGRKCPKYTIPIRRPKEKASIHLRNRAIRHLHNVTQNLHEPNHSYAVLLTGGFHYTGARGDIKVYNPWVESDDEYSASRIALKNGPKTCYEEIEVGWIVNPSVYGDKQTRLYVYWTVDGSKSTGCFDLTCPGFVQVDNEIALGAAIYPISKPGGDLPYQITVYVYKDPVTSNWWVNLGDRRNIGYFPPDIFGMLRHQANIVDWGGEVFSTRVGTTPHTATGMGSGTTPDFIFGTSGWVKRMRVQQNSHELMFPDFVSPYTDEYRCYEIWYVGDYVEDPEFYFGGPGRSHWCP